MRDSETQPHNRLLIVSQCFYPSVNRGGPAVSVTNMARALADHCDVSVITASYESGTKQAYTQVHEGKNRLFGCDVYYLREASAKTLRAAMRTAAPDVIYISSLFSAAYTVAALRFAKKEGKRVILAPQGELQPPALRRKRAKKLPYLMLLKLTGWLKNADFHATSADEVLEIKKHFPKARVCYAQNLVAAPEKAPRTREKSRGELHAVAVCRVHPIKGLDLAICALSCLTASVSYDIYGPIEDEAFYRRCAALAQQLPKNIRVCFYGAQPPQNIAKLLRNADLFLMPTRTENFGIAIAEALMSGCPAVIGNATPWQDLLAAKAGACLPPDGDYSAVLRMFADMDEREWRQWSDGAAAYGNARRNEQATVAAYLEMLRG